MLYLSRKKSYFIEKIKKIVENAIKNLLNLYNYRNYLIWKILVKE